MMGIVARYPLAKNGIFRTIQGEGGLLGTPMAFVRLAGCSIGCHGCDTDYAVHRRATAEEIGKEVAAYRTRWTWVTGGEPADHEELWQLLEALRLCGKVAVATSGHKSLGRAGCLIDFLSVSPHSPDNLILQRGSQINLVPGLNGLSLDDFFERHGTLFPEFHGRYLTPMAGSAESLEECLRWIYDPSMIHWRLGVQGHKQWGLP